MLVEMEREHSEEYKKQTTLHMMEVVETKIWNKTGKKIEVKFPETDEEKLKLQEMYDSVIANIGK